MAQEEVFIVDCVRSPIARGKPDGALHNVHPVDLLALTIEQLVARCGVDKGAIDDVIAAVVVPVGKQGANIGRLAALKAGFPVSVPGIQINRMGGSGQQAIHFAAQAILAGDMDMVIACGVEMLGVVKMFSDSAEGLFDGKSTAFTVLFPYKLVHQGVAAELVAAKYNVSREECDRYALESNRRAARAVKNSYWRSQIVPVPVEAKSADGQARRLLFAEDETIRFNSDYEKMSRLSSAFKLGGVVTAANASQVSDGAAALLLCSGRKADHLGLRKRARIVARAVTGSDPTLMLDGIIPATRLVLAKAGLTLEDIDFFEVNEAFACVVLSWIKTFGVDPSKVNPNGGVIAHGHPFGATGCILATKIVNELERAGKRYALQTACIGHGMATATIFENCSFRQSKL